MLAESASAVAVPVLLSELVMFTANVITQFSDRVVTENEMQEFKVRSYHLDSTL